MGNALLRDKMANYLLQMYQLFNCFIYTLNIKAVVHLRVTGKLACIED